MKEKSKEKIMCVDALPSNNQIVIVEVNGKKQKAKFQVGKFNIGMNEYRTPITDIQWWKAK